MIRSSIFRLLVAIGLLLPQVQFAQTDGLARTTTVELAARIGNCISFCSGACCGDLAVTDGNGQIRLDNFYREETESLYLVDKSGKTLWKSSPAILQNSTGVPTITLR